jgi:hypothetical protein
VTDPLTPDVEPLTTFNAATVDAGDAGNAFGRIATEPVEVPSANAPVIATVTCPNPVCGHRGSFIVVHADTQLPVHCGGCFAVLHCDHALETTITRSGTIGAPVEQTVTACALCNTETARKTVDLPPIELGTLPLELLDQTLDAGQIR